MPEHKQRRIKLSKSVLLGTAATSSLQSRSGPLRFPLVYLLHLRISSENSFQTMMKWTMNKWLKTESKGFYAKGIPEQFHFWSEKCVLKNGDYLEKQSKIFSLVKHELFYCKIYLFYRMTIVYIYIYIYMFMYI